MKHAGGKSVERQTVHSLLEDGINLTKELEHYENRLIGEAHEKPMALPVERHSCFWNRTTLVEKLKRKGFDPKSHGYSIQN